MRELSDIHYPQAERIRVVLLQHSVRIRAAALYETFPPAETRRLLRRLEFHYTPKHASWLNMVASNSRRYAHVNLSNPRCRGNYTPGLRHCSRNICKSFMQPLTADGRLH